MGIVTTIAPFALALIMLALGASLTVKDFTRVFQNPKNFCRFNLSINCSSNSWIRINYYFKNSN